MGQIDIQSAEQLRDILETLGSGGRPGMDAPYASNVQALLDANAYQTGGGYAFAPDGVKRSWQSSAGRPRPDLKSKPEGQLPRSVLNLGRNMANEYNAGVSDLYGSLGLTPKTIKRAGGMIGGRPGIRMAAQALNNPALRMAAKAAPALGVAGTALAAGDIVLGDESMANKAFDTLGMGGGALAGFALGGPLGATIGAGIGKSVMDGAQSLMGVDRASEQRKMEEAIAMLRGGMG